ncbi:hypothetical protein [Cyclobacterium marinum]|uniref:hypothetical protein n=1 Tax=Cyclobacterium marinum TaxID=104 RepID=UPI0011EFA7C9|nr:hypothetical protein [Cyclobacterium marinum]MBI0397698.1 hypothetical protein [Cyclobacterium marinum]
MELVLQFLFGIGIFNAVLHWSQHGLAGRLISAVTMALIAYLFYPWTLEQSREQFKVWMAEHELMQQLAVILVIEALIFISLDLALIKRFFNLPVARYLKTMALYPGLFWLVALLYFQMNWFYSFSGIEFETLAILYSLIILLVFSLLPLGLRALLPEPYLRMEIRYILSFGQIIGAIVITVLCQGIPYHPSYNSFELNSLLIFLGTVITLFLLGFLWSRIAKHIKLKWKF